MDDPNLPEFEHLVALAGLARINRATCIAAAMYRQVRRYAQTLGRPVRLLDIATGSGDMPIYWTKRAARDGIEVHCTGLDISHIAVEYAKLQAAKAKCDVQFVQRDVLIDRLPTGFDIVTCGLFIHHLSEPQIVHMLTSMQSAAGHAMIVCDLERSRANLAMVWIASQALSGSRVVHVDAIRSVHAALTREEFRLIAERALDRPIRVVGLPPCRYIATLDEATVAVPEAMLAGMQSA